MAGRYRRSAEGGIRCEYSDVVAPQTAVHGAPGGFGDPAPGSAQHSLCPREPYGPERHFRRVSASGAGQRKHDHSRDGYGQSGYEDPGSPFPIQRPVASGPARRPGTGRLVRGEYVRGRDGLSRSRVPPAGTAQDDRLVRGARRGSRGSDTSASRSSSTGTSNGLRTPPSATGHLSDLLPVRLRPCGGTRSGWCPGVF